MKYKSGCHKIALCNRGILGMVSHKDRHGVYHGHQVFDPTRKWQSKNPRFFSEMEAHKFAHIHVRSLQEGYAPFSS